MEAREARSPPKQGEKGYQQYRSLAIVPPLPKGVVEKSHQLYAVCAGHGEQLWRGARVVRQHSELSDKELDSLLNTLSTLQRAEKELQEKRRKKCKEGRKDLKGDVEGRLIDIYLISNRMRDVLINENTRAVTK